MQLFLLMTSVFHIFVMSCSIKHVMMWMNNPYGNDKQMRIFIVKLDVVSSI